MMEGKKNILETIEANVYALVKSKLILIDGDQDKVTNESKLTVNDKFVSKFKKVVVTRMNKKEKAEESKETEEKVSLHDRGNIINWLNFRSISFLPQSNASECG